jgi:CRP-like cAMP-binding protein
VAGVERLLTMVVRDSLAAQQTILSSSGGAAAERLVRVLLHADATLAPTPGHPLHLTQSDLAALIGIQRPTANRLLRELSDRGWIDLRRGRVRVVARDELEGSLAA